MRTWHDYQRTCQSLIGYSGRERAVSDIGPSDFVGLRNRLPHGLDGKPVSLITLSRMHVGAQHP